MEIIRKATIFGGYSVEVVLENGENFLLGTFTDDQKAIDAIEAFEKREFGVPDKDYGKLKPHEYIKAFQLRKNPFDSMNSGEFEVNDKAYSQFMINRMLTMTKDNVGIVGHICCNKMSNYAHAAYMARCVKKPRTFQKYIKEDKKAKNGKKLETFIEEMMEEFALSRPMAEEYCALYNLVTGD